MKKFLNKVVPPKTKSYHLIVESGKWNEPKILDNVRRETKNIVNMLKD
jgi:hypothetical protein